MKIYQYSLGLDGIREKIYDDIFVNDNMDRFIIEEMNDLGGYELFELRGVDDEDSYSDVMIMKGFDSNPIIGEEVIK